MTLEDLTERAKNLNVKESTDEADRPSRGVSTASWAQLVRRGGVLRNLPRVRGPRTDGNRVPVGCEPMHEYVRIFHT